MSAVPPALLADASPHLAALADVSGSIGCSAFIAYAYLSDLDRLSPDAARSIEVDRAAIYRWYLTDFAARHRPLRVPLSDGDIAYLLEPDPLLAPLPIPRVVAWEVLAPHSGAPRLDGPDAVATVMAWWRDSRAPAMGIDDRLVSRSGPDPAPRTGSSLALDTAAVATPALRIFDADVQVVGPIHQRSGLGRAARLSIETFRRMGLKVVATDYAYGFPSQSDGGLIDPAALAEGPAAAALFHLNPDMLPLAFAFQRQDWPARKAGYFFWELDAPACCDFLALDLIDAVWTASGFVKSVYEGRFNGAVTRVGLAMPPVIPPDNPAARKTMRDLAALRDDAFVYLSVFDGLSYVARKNPLGAIAAFQAAFPGDEGVALVIKTQNRLAEVDGTQGKIWAAVSDCAASDPRIRLLDISLPHDQVLSLIAGADAFVSLHRSEGWGLGPAEAMQLGTPVVATAYGGTEDFCDGQTAFKVACTKTPVGPDDYVHVEPGRFWAEPDLGSAVDALRQVRTDVAARASRSAAGQKRIAETLSFETVGKAYVEALERLLAKT